MIVEQLAGDAVGEDAATGFIVGGGADRVKSPNELLTRTQRQDELADMIGTTGSSMLGLTVGCARCHDHKFDPIPQRDYYALQAVFAGVQHEERPLRWIDGKEMDNEHLAAPKPGCKRPPVNAGRNEEPFSPTPARAVRFTILATNDNAEPCIDELEIYEAGDEDPRAERGPGGGRGPGQFFGQLRGQSAAQARAHQRRPVWKRAKLDFQRARPRLGADRLAENGDHRPYRLGSRPPETIYGSAAGPVQDRNISRAESMGESGFLGRSRAVYRSGGAGHMVYGGRFVQPGPTYRLNRGDPMQPREPVVAEGLSVLKPLLGSLGLTPDAPEQQRRLALARWIARPDNPLTARVIVNRLWHYHFGNGIVASPSDFGRMGTPPTHPELLDWLATELVRGGWRLKPIHRLILLSNTYQQSSMPNPAGWPATPATVCSGAIRRGDWRPRPFATRSCRAAASWISPCTARVLAAFEPNDNYVRVYTPKETWGPADWRRMVYMNKVRREQDAVFGAFDAPDAGQVCPRRSRSTTPLQALNLLNSSFLVQQSDLLAKRVERESRPEIADHVRRAFLITLGRGPRADEAAAGEKLVQQHGLPSLCRALFNANEFLFIP